MRNMFHRFLCRIKFHDVVVVQEFSPTTRKLLCLRCGQYLGMNDEVRVVIPWDEELEDMYANVFGFGRTIK